MVPQQLLGDYGNIQLYYNKSIKFTYAQNWIILTLTSTLDVPLCKFKYQSMYDHYLFNLFNHYADYHLPDQHANIIQLSKL